MDTAQTPGKTLPRLRSLLCIFMACVLATSMTPIARPAYAANEDKPSSVIMQLGDQTRRTDVMKQVVTLDANMGKGITIPFDVTDNYNNLGANEKRRYLVSEDAQGVQSQLSEASGNRVGFMSDQIVAGQKLKLVTSTKDKNGNFVKRYEQQLNVRFIDTKKAEQKPSNVKDTSPAAGMSKDGSTWSFTDGMEVKLQNTGFKFLDGTSINLGGMMLPLKYKHENDGTTIVGINCDPNNVAFYQAVKNGNAFQKFSSEKMLKMVEQMEKGWSGKGFGKWGGKGFDWNVMGYMEFNTKNPQAPRAVNLIISMGLKAEGHAQYLCFTGTLTFSIGGKATLTGKLTPAKGLEGVFKLGGYGALELYVGLGLNYVASIGTYGKGRIDVDFQILPKVFLDLIKVSGEFGVKAKVFGFTLFTWKILSGEKQLYPKEGTKKMPAANEDGSATSPFDVDADTAYPVDSRAYLNNGGTLAAGQSEALTTQATKESSTILRGIYGETELTCATTNDGPVVAYIADAAQVGDDSRSATNRSVLVYSRFKDGKWTNPKIIDTTSSTKGYADYSPTISTDGENCYVSWLAADSEIKEGATIGEVGGKLDVNVATITKDDVITVETVCEESSENGSMPADPKAVKVGSDLYVGWYTNQTTGKSGEVIGVSGTHTMRLYKKNGDKWDKSSEVKAAQSGAITSFDVGSYGGTPACAWSLDEQFTSEQEEVTLNGVKTLASSSVYCLTPNATAAQLVAMSATNAQFAKSQGADVLTYAIRIDANDGVSNPYISVQSSPEPGKTGKVVLDGAKIYLPTTYYQIAGDIGDNRAGNISFLKAGDGTCDIQALVTTGAGNEDWTSRVEATSDSNTVTDYCATYANGVPLFIYATVPATAENGQGTQADDDGSVDLNQSTDESLKHFSVDDVDYDEYEVDAGQKMPVTAYFSNDGMLDTTGVDLWMLENGEATKVASSDDAIAIDNDSSISFEYTLPAKDQFTKAREFTLYAAPKGAAVDKAKIERELSDGSAMTVSFGGASLSLETEHQIIDDQESINATVTNDGIAPHGAKLVFLDSKTNRTIKTVDVPVLGENEKFTAKLDASRGYFQNEGVKDIVITLEDDGTEAPGYELNNTEFVSTWDVSFAGKAQQAGFTDLESGAWYMKEGFKDDAGNVATTYLDHVVGRGLMSGYSDTTLFGPNDKLSRGMVATIIYRMATGATADVDNDVDAGFTDVPRGAWYAAAVKWCAENGVTTGYTGTTLFDPEGDVTRAQLATFIFRYCTKVLGMDPGDGDISKFPDKDQIPDYARLAAAFCNANGIVIGYSDSGNFGPADFATRCQAAKIIAVTDCLEL